MTRAFLCETGDKSDARRLLALVFRTIYGGECPEVVKDAHGKPYFSGRQDVCFSISHTGTYVMTAIGDLPCGCDVERVRQVRKGVPERVAGEEELAALGFFNCWVLKESYLKVRGVPIDFRGTRFSIADGVIRTPSPEINAVLFDCPGCRAAVCCEGEPPENVIFVPREALDQKTFPGLLQNGVL